mmetsp:Transcript_39528/g.92994  ORF Transcript_39528/g.92994 Transcript_39528/m.92994 type:complete len:472 (+) Transcript_39528:185-1600(+)
MNNFDTTMGSKLVINTKNTFLELEEDMPRDVVEPRSASCPPRCWKAKLELDSDSEDDASNMSTASSNSQGRRMVDIMSSVSETSSRQPSAQSPCPSNKLNVLSWADSATSFGEDDLFSPALSSRSPWDSNCSPLSSPRRGSDCNDNDCDGPCTSPRKPRRRGRGRRGRKVEFSAELDKRTGMSHGIDIDWSNGVHLLIEKVNTPGLVAAWNQEHPDQEICAGHCIVEVNGVRGVASDLLEEMKKEQLLSLKIQFQKPRETAAQQPAAPNQASVSPTRTPLRTVLTSQAPIFQPAQVRPSTTLLATGSTVESTWMAPKGMQAEFVEAVEALRAGLAGAFQASWALQAPTSTSVCFSASTSSSFNSTAVVTSVQQAVLNVVAKFPSVFLMGRNANPFQALSCGKLGFRVVLCTIDKDRFQTVCWDTVGKGYCPRGCSCTWAHPQGQELLEVQIQLPAAGHQNAFASYASVVCR